MRFETANKTNGFLGRRVLLLNQSYEPLAICTVKKAIILLFLDKAHIVAKRDDEFLHSAKTAFPFPTVIRLNNYVNVPFRHAILTRKNIIKRDGHKCAYCGRNDIPLTVDHIIPKARGGKDNWENLVCACFRCNNKKGNKTPEEAGMTLKVKPYVPNRILFIKHASKTIDDTWRPYLFE